MDLLFLLGFILALCGHVQGGPHKPPPSFTEQPPSGVGAKAVVAKPRSLRLDYAFYADGISCRDFWQASGPKQTQPPITAWRQAFKQTLEAGIQSAKVAAKVASISVVCNDPPPEFSNDLRRVSLTAQLTPDLIFNDLALVFYYVYNSLQNTFDFRDSYIAVAGINSPFQPIIFDYKEDNKYSFLCPVGFGFCGPYRWDPTSVLALLP